MSETRNEDSQPPIKLSDLYWGPELSKKDKFYTATFETKSEPIFEIMYVLVDLDNIKEE
jgi:hypothetical protein